MSAASVVHDLVPRHELVDRVKVAAQGRLTVIGAPGGYGKTVLLEQLNRDGRAVLRDAAGIDGNLTADVSESGLLVIDNLESSSMSRTLEEVDELIERGPKSLRIVLAGRIDSAFLRERYSRIEVSCFAKVDLAFNRADAELLVRNTAGKQALSSVSDDLFAHMNGWAVGLRLAALDIRDGREPLPAAHRGGTPIESYLDEIVESAPRSVQDFLLHTAMLDELSAPLCDAVAGSSTSKAMLRLLCQDSMFLNCVDEPASTFVYEPFFRNYLRAKLRSRPAGFRTGILRAAADWYVARDDLVTAGKYLRRAEAWDEILELATSQGQMIYSEGRIPVLVDLVKSIPVTIRNQCPEVLLREAMLESVAGDRHASEAAVNHAVSSLSMDDGEMLVVNLIRTTWVERQSVSAAVIDAAEAVLAAQPVAIQNMPDTFGILASETIRWRALLALGRERWFEDRVDESRALLRAAVKDAERAPSDGLVDALGALALVDAWSGRLVDANASVTRALQMANLCGWFRSACSTNAHLAFASLLRERGLYSSAEAALDRAEASATSENQTTLLAVHATERAFLDLVRGNCTDGLDVLSTIIASPDWDPPVIVSKRFRQVEARLRLAHGDSITVEQMVAADELTESNDLRAVAVELAVAQRDVATARTLLDNWVGDRQISSHVCRGLWLSVVTELEGDRRMAQHYLSNVLQLAEREGFLSLFIAAGPDVRRLLRIHNRSNPGPYLNRILREWDKVDGAQVASKMSDRELMVLRYLPTGLPNAEIASELYVSLNTVKTHLRNIYRHLDVHRRQEAIERAVERGIV